MLLRFLVRTGLFSAFGLFNFAASAEDFRANALFSDHMVVQRGQPVRVYGAGPDGADVSATLGGHTAHTKVEHGQWQVELAAMEAGGPYTLTVEGPTKLTFSDVMIGDVWVIAGQSNMRMLLKNVPLFEKNPGAWADPNVRIIQSALAWPSKPATDMERDKQFARGWLTATAESLPAFSAAGYFFGHELEKKLQIPIGLINVSRGATTVQAWMDEAFLHQIDPETKPFVNSEDSHDPVVSYNGMVAPIQKFPIKGVIWNQGEGNITETDKYTRLFTGLISHWREQWGQGDFPFYFVETASYGGFGWDKSLEASGWLREAQANARSASHTGLVVTVDLGDYFNPHFKGKLQVGERLAALALKYDYGMNVVAEGPRFKEMEIKGREVVLHFDHIDGGLEARDLVMTRQAKGKDPETDTNPFHVPAGTLSGFLIAGADQKFVDATARIDGDTIIVSSPSISAPVAVRYAWKDFSVANLYNGSGLPMEPFRTDHFPPPTELVQGQKTMKAGELKRAQSGQLGEKDPTDKQ